MPRYCNQLPEWVIKKIFKAFQRKTLRGIANELIDIFLHPLFGKTFGIAEIADFILHCVNEGQINIDKFLKYNLRSFLYSLRALAKYLRELNARVERA